MPELPEVETIVRQLAPSLPGREIRRVIVSRPDLLVEASRRFRSSLRGSRILEVGRRGKNIVLTLSDPQLLVIHLGMTGQLHLSEPPAAGKTPPYRGVSFELEPGGFLHYADARRFGHLRRFSPSQWEAVSAELGPEPLDPVWSTHHLQQALSRSRSPIRSWLLDQRRVAGIGNIYANEALFRARVHPARPAGSLSRAEVDRLHRSIRRVLDEAIEARGTTLRDYRTAEGQSGGFGPSLLVYGREGDLCGKCNTPIERIVFGNRSAFLCPRCQPREP